MTPLALLGGTFDPIHLGHLAIADYAHQVLGCQISLMPNAVPVHKAAPGVTTTHRLAMLKLACEGIPYLNIEQIELNREGPSYAVDTLKLLRQEHPNSPIIFIIGADSLKSLPTWHQADALLTLCHFLVVPRAGFILPESALAHPLVAPNLCQEVAPLLNETHGYIHLLNTPVMAVSSTEIRAHLHNGTDATQLVPKRVLKFIQDNQLYLLK